MHNFFETLAKILEPFKRNDELLEDDVDDFQKKLYLKSLQENGWI